MIYIMVEQYKQHILSYYNSIPKPHNTDDLLWYLRHHLYLQELAIRHNRPIEFLAASCAVMSINKRWDQNKLMLEEYLETGDIKGMNVVKNKIQQLEECNLDHDCIMGILSGKKIQNFYGNLLRPYCKEFITIDRHMATIAGEQRKMNSGKRYDELAQAYREVAHGLNILPNRLQSLLWSYKIKEK